VIMINPATTGGAVNVFWNVGSAATIKTGGTVIGTIMADQGIAVGYGATTGPLLASIAAVTLLTDTVTAYNDYEKHYINGTVPSRAPSARPTFRPTSTFAPSAAPSAQQAPVVSFASTMGITGYSGAVNSDNTVTLSPASLLAIETTAADTMNLDVSAVTVKTVTVVARRRLTRTRQLTTVALSVIFETTVSMVDHAGTNATALYTALTNKLSTAVTSGAMVDNLRTNAAIAGSPLDTASVTDISSAAAAVVNPPTFAPTKGPKDRKYKGLSNGGIIGVVVAGFVLWIITMGVYVLYCRGSASDSRVHNHKI
jgi:hypothetical protein